MKKRLNTIIDQSSGADNSKKKLRRCLCVSTSKLGGSSIWWRWVDSVEQIAPGHCSGDGVADTLGILQAAVKLQADDDPWSAWSSVRQPRKQIMICRQIRLRPNGKLKLWACWGFNNILGSGSTIWEKYIFIAVAPLLILGTSCWRPICRFWSMCRQL